MNRPNFGKALHHPRDGAGVPGGNLHRQRVRRNEHRRFAPCFAQRLAPKRVAYHGKSKRGNVLHLGALSRSLVWWQHDTQLGNRVLPLALSREGLAPDNPGIAQAISHRRWLILLVGCKGAEQSGDLAHGGHDGHHPDSLNGLELPRIVGGTQGQEALVG